MRTIHPSKSAAALIAGLALVGSLAACSSPAPADTDTGSDTGSDTETDTGDDAASDTGAYADGTYEATGDYQAPSGTETVDVTVTLADGIITDVQVVGAATDPTAQERQAEFIGGIAGEVVGKSIDEIQVSKVAGSSLTSGGFNKAIEEIKVEAAA